MSPEAPRRSRSVALGCSAMLAVGCIVGSRQDPAIIRRIRAPGYVGHFAVSGDGRMAVVGCDAREDGVVAYDLETGRELWRHNWHAGDLLWSVALSGDGRVGASGGERGGYICLWNAATGELTGKLKVPWSTTSALAFSPDGKRLASGSHDTTVRLWDLTEKRLLWEFGGKELDTAVEDVCFSPDGRYVAGAFDEWPYPDSYRDETELYRRHSRTAMRVLVLDAADGSVVASLPRHPGPATGVRFLADGERLLTHATFVPREEWRDEEFGHPGEYRVFLWRWRSGEKLMTLTHRRPVLAAAPSPDGIHALVLSLLTGMRLWNLETGELVKQFRNACTEDVVFTPDGQRAVTGAGMGIRVWDIRQYVQDHRIRAASRGGAAAEGRVYPWRSGGHSTQLPDRIEKVEP